jgi:Mrp family chromosome partitioning ATPase
MRRDLPVNPAPQAGLRVVAPHEPSPRDLQFLSRTIAREFRAPDADNGVVLAFSCPDADALCTDFMLAQADSLGRELESTVLLIDARGRRREGGLTERLGLAGKPGVADAIAAGSGVAVPEPHRTPLPGVAILPAGLATLPGSAAFEAGVASLVAWARPRYRHVLLQVGDVAGDTRDLLAAVQGDSAVIVAREHQTSLGALQECATLLRENGARDVSAVIVEAVR